MFKRIIMLTAVIMLLSGCGGKEPVQVSYRQITQEEAAELLRSQENYLLLDVRTQAEFEGGHIPGAICIPNETIGTEAPAQLPDKSQMLLVYCRSGNRSKQAAEKLAKLGYTNVLEFGGINTWTGETVPGSEG